jgi:hypothetical protein
MIGKLTLFGLGLALIFTTALGAGSLVEPADTAAGPGHAEGMVGMGDGGHPAMATTRGLAVAEDGLTLRLSPTHAAAGRRDRLRFSIVGSDGAKITDFDRLHTRRMHLILVRRDGSGFRHLHPEMDAAGTWRVGTRFARPGVYRAYADFSVGGTPHTLATDLFVAGAGFRPEPFPAPVSTVTTDGYEVVLAGEGLAAGRDASLGFTVERNGRPVEAVAPYLGARGHLVALREGDLAFLHVHPEEHGSAGGEIAFGATFPSPGRYRLYLQFRHAGAVHTAEFTVEVQR